MDGTIKVIAPISSESFKGASKNLFVDSRESNLQKTRKGEGA
jgi:hypothetical protein